MHLTSWLPIRATTVDYALNCRAQSRRSRLKKTNLGSPFFRPPMSGYRLLNSQQAFLLLAEFVEAAVVVADRKGKHLYIPIVSVSGLPISTTNCSSKSGFSRGAFGRGDVGYPRGLQTTLVLLPIT